MFCFREVEWLFNTKEGRLQLAESANCQSLVVVHLQRDQVMKMVDSWLDKFVRFSKLVTKLAQPALVMNLCWLHAFHFQTKRVTFQIIFCQENKLFPFLLWTCKVENNYCAWMGFELWAAGWEEAYESNEFCQPTCDVLFKNLKDHQSLIRRQVPIKR